MATDLSAGPRGATAGRRALRVDLLIPCFWPEVRRGAERLTHELGRSLALAGHAPRIVTSHPGPPSLRTEHGVQVLRLTRPPSGALRRHRWEEYVTHVPLSYAAVRTRRPDVVHAMHGPDAAAALRYKDRSGRPAVFSFMGIPDHDGMFYRRGRLGYVMRALEGCDAVVALSRFAAGQFRQWFGYEARVIEPGVDVVAFQPVADRAADPTIVCAADPGEPRKNVSLLVEAFRLVRRQRGRARLMLSRPRDPSLATALAGAADGVEVVDLDDRAALVRTYSSAWVSALPSVDEAFGLVLLEAMSCGTPAVGSARGGIPEVIDRPEVGRLVDELTPRSLAAALLEALELAEDPATRGACRARAEELSTERMTARYLGLYEELL